MYSSYYSPRGEGQKLMPEADEKKQRNSYLPSAHRVSTYGADDAYQEYSAGGMRKKANNRAKLIQSISPDMGRHHQKDDKIRKMLNKHTNAKLSASVYG